VTVIHRRADTARVWVEDRSGARLPYSKGLMATSIMATGLGPGPAYRLAAAVEERLAALGVPTVSADDLAAMTVDVIEREAGPGSAARYEAWRRAKRSPAPILVLIGGASGVGKSTVASKLAARLGITRVITTDTVREIMRNTIPDAKPLARSSFEGEGSSRQVIAHFRGQAEVVCTGIGGLLERLVHEREDVIVEGVHLVPGAVQPDVTDRLAAGAAVVHVILRVTDEEKHRAHFVGRLESQHGRTPGRYLGRLGAIRMIQDYTCSVAAIHGVPVIDAIDLDETIQLVLDHVVDRVTALAPDRTSLAVG
jgi:2-phosphoglycerate kinase